MTICEIQTTNPLQVEIGVEYFLPTDSLNYIPNGFETVSFTLDKEDFEDAPYTFLSYYASAWCACNGYIFNQLIEEY